jgi:hypothetical protein
MPAFIRACKAVCQAYYTELKACQQPQSLQSSFQTFVEQNVRQAKADKISNDNSKEQPQLQ